jgi:glycosyltransferase involved in cell wall biosynthesis
VKIAFFYERAPGQMPPYARDDFETLTAMGETRWAPPVRSQRWRRGLGPSGWLPSREILDLVSWCDVAVQWFATTPAPALAARLRRKPLIVIAGGYDVAYLPAVDYGLMVDPRTRAMARTTLWLARRVLAVSAFTLGEVRRWVPRANAAVLPLGFDAARFDAREPKHPAVATVSRIGSDFIRKGLETFVSTAARLPDIPFLIVGPIDVPDVGARLRHLATPNVTFTGGVEHAQVARHIGPCSIYAQLSLHESFCGALAEAMLCRCTPVATRCGALPEVAGDVAYYTEPGDPGAAAAAIRAAMTGPRGDLARERIATLFPAARRASGLRGEIGSLV